MYSIDNPAPPSLAWHDNASFNAVVNEAIARVHLALQMVEDNRRHAQAHEAWGIAKQDGTTLAQLTKAKTWLKRAVRS